VQVASAAWRAATRTVARVGDLVQRTGDGHTGRVLGGRAVKRSGGASKPAATVFAGLALKPVAMVSSGLASKPAAMVFACLASKPVAMVSPGLASKPVVGFLVEPQNQSSG
jgi:hypothetical protein